MCELGRRDGGIVDRPRLFLITDRAFDDDWIVQCVEAAAGVLPRGWLAVQLRDKERAQVSLRVFASRLRLVTRRLHAWLFINGDAKLARDVGADGVHLGRGSGTVQSARAVCRPETLVSVAVHSDDDVRRALEEGADVSREPYISDCPAMWSVESRKPRRRAASASCDKLVEIAGARLGVYALGGVTADRVGDCSRAGADGVAVIRALLESANPAQTARAMYESWARC